MMDCQMPCQKNYGDPQFELVSLVAFTSPLDRAPALQEARRVGRPLGLRGCELHLEARQPGTKRATQIP